MCAKQRQSRSLLQGAHHQQNNLSKLKIYQPGNKNEFSLIKIISIINHDYKFLQ